MNFALLSNRLARWSSEVAASSAKWSVSPLLIFALMDRESGGGEELKPPSHGGVGDGGHGRGLMQIDDRAHHDWVATARWWDAATNIDKGAEVIAGNQKLFRAEDGLPPVIAAYNAGAHAVRKTLRMLPRPCPQASMVLALDSICTANPKPYVSDVLERYMRFFKAVHSEDKK